METVKDVKGETKGKQRFNKGFSLLLILAFSLGVCGKAWFDKIKKKTDANVYRNESIEKAKKLEELNFKYRDKHSQNEYTIKNFSIEKNTLGFKNFGTQDSKNGQCEGISYFEKFVYANSLSSFSSGKFNFNNRDLGSIKLSKNDAKTMYGDKDDPYNYSTFKDMKGDIDFEFIYDVATGRKTKPSGKNHTFKISQIQDKNLANLINIIEELQKNKGFSRYTIEPYYSTYETLEGADILKKYRKIDINLIVDNMKKDNPVVFAMLNPTGGHAVLAYKYEFIDQNNLKLYVSDSNLPYNSNSDAKKDINKDIVNNDYVLFTKDILNNDWSCIYEPVIGNKKVYGEYNSFIPNTYIYIEL